MSKFAAAGKELMKGNIGNAIKIAAINTKSVESELIQPSRYRNGSFFFGINGADKAFIWGNFNSSLVAYQQCPVVSSIINKKASCIINGITKIVDNDNQEINTVQAVALRKLLKKPNAIQSGKQFKAQQSVYKQIYGYCPVLVIKPVGFEADYSKWKLWNLPPWMILAQTNTNLFYESDAKPFTSILLTYMGHSVYLNPDSVFFIKENQISTGTYMYNGNTNNVSLHLPDSRLFAVEKPINNLIASLNSRGSLIQERGPQWLLTNDSADSAEQGLFPIDEEAKKDLHKDFLQYGIMAGQRKAIITDAKLKLQTVGFNVQELQLLEGEIQDAKMICDQLNYPPYLMGLVDAKFDNQDIAERNLYTNAIIPDCESDDEQISSMLGLEAFGLKITTDFKHLPALQENEEKKGRGALLMNQALVIEFYNNQITWNEWRVERGRDTVPGMDKYYKDLLAEGYVFGLVPNTAPLIENNAKPENNG